MPASKPTPIAIAIVQHAGNVLIGQRPQAVPLAGLWEFPGGKLQAGETFSQAAQRECREETGLDVRVGEEQLAVIHAYGHGQVELHFLAAAPVDPRQLPLKPFRWVPLGDLARYEFPAANAGILERLRRGK
jgi:A/G-specific adenine glycosylase